MPSPKVFDTPAGGPVPLPQHVHNQEEAAHTVPQKRSADTLDVETDDQSSLSKKPRLVLTANERARYERLRADKLCHVRSGQFVQCDRCGAVIKLSSKNNYDLEHWGKHRKLCVKRSDKYAQSLRNKSSLVLGPRETSCTPELTADSASEATATSGSVKSEPASSPPPPSSPSPPPIPIPDPTPWLDARREHESEPLTAPTQCAAYMARFHPDATPFDPSAIDVLEELKRWTPARLKIPAELAGAGVPADKLRLRPARWEEREFEDEDEAMDDGSLNAASLDEEAGGEPMEVSSPSAAPSSVHVVTASVPSGDESAAA
ncbi:hypothetical protein GY45DRAFT_1359335 [Cubamyces sp. BRFM 1775]|nr:hypothetical protein GY45DRAFT_1359335 [Cubamyces sp. BRFM 1775]